MEKLRLVLSDVKYKDQYLDFIRESGDDIKSTGFDSVIPLSDGEKFESDVDRLTEMHLGKELHGHWVPASTYWLMDDNDSQIIGVVIIRHYLNERLKFRGGNIAYYVRPSERNKGYAVKMLSLALEHCKRLGMTRVLMTCKKENVYSAGVIVKNGGKLHSEDTDRGEVFQRYWIECR